MNCTIFGSEIEETQCIGIAAGIGALILLLSVAVIVLACCVCKLKRRAVAGDQEQNDVNKDLNDNHTDNALSEIQKYDETSLNNSPTEVEPRKENDAKPKENNCGNQKTKSVRKSESSVAITSVVSNPNNDQDELQTKNECKEDEMKQKEETDDANPYAEVKKESSAISLAQSDMQFERQASEQQQKLLENTAEHYTLTSDHEKQTELEKQSALPVATKISEDYDHLFKSSRRETVTGYETVVLPVDPPANYTPNEDFDFPPPLPPPFVDDDENFLLSIPEPLPNNFDDEMRSPEDENVYDLPDDL